MCALGMERKKRVRSTEMIPAPYSYSYHDTCAGRWLSPARVAQDPPGSPRLSYGFAHAQNSWRGERQEVLRCLSVSDHSCVVPCRVVCRGCARLSCCLYYFGRGKVASGASFGYCKCGSFCLLGFGRSDGTRQLRVGTGAHTDSRGVTSSFYVLGVAGHGGRTDHGPAQCDRALAARQPRAHGPHLGPGSRRLITSITLVAYGCTGAV